MADSKKIYLPAAFILIFFTSLLLLPVKESEVLRIQRECLGTPDKEKCYALAFENLTNITDWEHSFEVLRELQKVEPESRGCHFIAHSIATAETRKNPSRWKELMNSAPQDCSYGAAHGALEVYASTFSNGKLPKSEIPHICDNPDINNCTHILGHLLLILNEDNIPESLKDCNRLPHDESGKFECLTGVFMERITAINLTAHGLASQDALNWQARVQELEKLCRKQSGTSATACWKEITHAALIKFDNNSQKIVNFCETAPEETQARECIDHSLGIIAGSHNFDLSKMAPICEARARAADFKDRCYANLVISTLSTIPQELESAKNFCSSIELRYQPSCFKMIDNFTRRDTINKRSDTIN